MAEKSEEARTDGEAQRTAEWVLDFRICMKNSGRSMCVHPKMKVVEMNHISPKFSGAFKADICSLGGSRK